MAEPAVKRPADNARDQSLGSLVSLAVSDVSQLVKCEIDLAKMELKKDAIKVGIGAVLVGMAAFAGCLILMLACFAFAYGLQTVGVWSWLSFIYVALTCVVLAGIAVFIAYRKFRKLSGLRKTRQTVQDDLSLLKRDDGAAAAAPAARAS